MSIMISNYPFEGPFTSTDYIANKSGVYVILGNNGGNQWDVIDVGESGGLCARISNHDRGSQWRSCGYSVVGAAVFYCNEHDRMILEQHLRQTYNPPCGVR